MRATGKNERIAQILETDVTREQLAEVVWSMERDHASHVELIKELMGERAEMRSENAKLREMCSDLMGWIAYTTMGERVPEDAYCALEDRMSALGIGADEWA